MILIAHLKNTHTHHKEESKCLSSSVIPVYATWNLIRTDKTSTEKNEKEEGPGSLKCAQTQKSVIPHV